jgi:uncharacterized protein (DUF983 family)
LEAGATVAGIDQGGERTMSDTQAERTPGADRPTAGYRGERAADRPTGWVGWVIFAGIVLAVISAIVNLAFIAAYPVWGVILIAVDIVIIYALTMHGREMKSA